MSIIVEKIISGGQSGGDMGGLLAGQALGIETGGYCPANWLTENGSTPELRDFGLQCTHAKGYPPRTRLNVAYGDATLGFGNCNSPGMKLTSRICDELSKPYYHIPYPYRAPGKNTFWENYYVYLAATKEWVQDNKIYILNVAGNRESKNPGIQEFVKEFVIKIINIR